MLPFYSFNLFIKTVVTVLQYHSWKIFYNKVFAYFKNDNASELLVIFSFLFLPNLSFLTLIFFYLPTLPIVNFNPPTVFILVKWLKFSFINSCHDNPHRLLYFLLFFYFYFTFTNALFWLSPLLRLISYLFFRSEHVVPGPSSRLETCFPFMLGTSWFTTFVLFKTMGGTSTAILCKCWPLSFFSLVPRFCASYFYLFLPLYFLYTDF